MYRKTVIVRGGGDIASGTIYKLFQSGYRVIILEVEKPTSIRRTVSFSQCVYDGVAIIEGVKSKLCQNFDEMENAAKSGVIPVFVDSYGDLIKKIKPDIVIDGILAKINKGTKLNMANIVIGLGPGFEAGIDVHAVIETNRGHDLGKVIYKGIAEKDTGVPGNIDGYSLERVIYSPQDGRIKLFRNIGDLVKKDEKIAIVADSVIKSKIDGVLRGIIMDGSLINKGMKIGDVDPRGNKSYCYTISEKARAIAGGVLEAILHLQFEKEKEKHENYKRT